MKQNIYDNETFFAQYEQIRKRPYNYNNTLEQPNFLALLPSVVGKVVLDIGCGAGDFAAHCVKQGARHVTGIDISANMITAAKKHTDDNLHFEQIAFEDMPIQPESVDIVTSSLAFHYIADFDQLMEKISVLLRQDGILVFSMEHPISTANKGGDDWIKNEHGQITHFALDNYQSEGMRKENWLVDGVIMYHRTMATILNTLIHNGLSIENVVEPVPTEAVSELYPNIQKEFRRPSFLFIKARKMTDVKMLEERWT